MLLLAIVDDDPRDAGNLRECVENYLQKTQEAHVIREFRDGVELIRSPEEYDIVFLDIRLEKIDGLEVARFLRRINKDTVLIFVTNMAQFAIHGYEVDAMDFILKPADQFSIDRVMDKALGRIQSLSGVPLILKTAEGAVRISSKSVWYVEVYNHDLIYHTEEGDFKVRGQLGEVHKRLAEEHFILCSRSYLVNLRYVGSVGAGFLMVKGERIPISKSHRKEIEQRFVNYLGESL